jgi:hypothetical protein
MKKKKHNASDKIVDFTDIKLKKEQDNINQALDDMAELDCDEFKIEMVKTLRVVAKRFKVMQSILKSLTEILFMENVLNQEHREGRRLSIEQLTSLADGYGIDYKKWLANASKKAKRKK